jgi:NTE family protein
MSWWNFGKKKIGLVLGGGVARGLAHVGVIRVLDKNKIPIDYIAATSSGAMVGVLYAAGLDIGKIEEIALKISWGSLLRLAFFRPGLVTSQGVEKFVVDYVGDKDFSELKIPLACVASDIMTGEAVVFKKGKVAKAVAASAAFPGLFIPVEAAQKYCVDGGIANNLPVDVVEEMGANFVIASDVIPSKPATITLKDPLQVFGRSLDIMLHKTSLENRKRADVLIEPYINEDVWHLDLHKAKHLIAAGEVAAQRIMNLIKLLT